MMLLTKVEIHKYKSFLTQQSYSVEQRITRIVGKNESGKTALLESLAKSNYFEDNPDFKFNKDLDYPRSELIKARNENPAAITCEYLLSDEEIRNIEETFGVGILKNKNFAVTSYYDDSKKASGITANFDIFKKWLITYLEINETDSALISSVDSFADLETFLTENTTISKAEEINSEISKIKNEGSKWGNPLEGFIFKKFILPSIPKLWYFSDYFSLPSRININDFAANNSSKMLLK